MQPSKYLQYIFPFFNTERTKEIFSGNPTVAPTRAEAQEVCICAYSYSHTKLVEKNLDTVEEVFEFTSNDNLNWINIDGLRKTEVEKICNHFGVDSLIAEDILSISQRPKMDELHKNIYCLLNMLYFNEKAMAVEQEQISIVLGKNYVLTFQEDSERDVFATIRDKIRMPDSRIRNNGADYLCYSLIDVIIDHYFLVMEKLTDRIEALEEEIIRDASTRSLARTNSLRKELIVLRRNVLPVRDVVNGFIRSENELLENKTIKYFKDVYDHIVQAADMVESYRDMMMYMQDLYLNKANIKLNEVMKIMALVTCLLAPATIIGGIFGMNFDRIPWLHNKYGFFIAVGLMLLIPLWMIRIFKQRGWFKQYN